MKCSNCGGSVDPGESFCGECGHPLLTRSIPVEDSTTFSIVLVRAGAKKIQVIKEVCAYAGLGLKQAKDLVESAPRPIKERISKGEGEEIKARLEALGATVSLMERGMES